jgi:hypothetical protein
LSLVLPEPARRTLEEVSGEDNGLAVSQEDSYSVTAKAS